VAAVLSDETPAARDDSVFPHSFGLTKRETDVLRFVGARYGNAEIAERLGISKRTVESHVAALFRKLDVLDRPALIRAARGAQALPPRTDAQARHLIRAAAARARAEAELQRNVARNTVRLLSDAVAQQRVVTRQLDVACQVQRPDQLGADTV
jgi:DNA-binding CsgD family transcriptional regulator